MKEIGLKLKTKREEDGVSLEEAASDLKIRESQLKNIEEGNREAFDDVITIKYIIRDYSKYLGLDVDSLLDEFNQYLYEETSKISLEDIELARKAKEEKEKNMKILSPYTVTSYDRKRKYIIIGAFLLVIILIIVGYIVISKNSNKDDFIDNEYSYRIGEVYEFS